MKEKLAFDPTGKYLASAGKDHTIFIWDLEKGRPYKILHGHTGLISGAAFVNDGNWLVSAGADASLRLWDVDSGRTLRIFQGHNAQVSALAVRPGSDDIYSTGHDRRLLRWQLALAPEQQLLKLPLPADDALSAFVLDVDTDHAVAAVNQTDLRLYSLAKGDWIAEVPTAHDDYIARLALHPRGSRLASASYDGTVKFWKIQRERELFAGRRPQSDAGVENYA